MMMMIDWFLDVYSYWGGNILICKLLFENPTFNFKALPSGYNLMLLLRGILEC